MKTKGYTLIEILMGVFAVAILSAAITPLVMANYQVNNAQSMADQTISYAKIYVRYLLNKDNDIRKTIKNQTIAFIPWSSIKVSNYIPTGSISDTNSLGQTPCVVVMENSITNQLMPFLFFVGGDARQKRFSTLDANNTINQIGGMAGVFVNDPNDKDVRQSGAGVFGNKAGWFLGKNSEYIKQIQSGCGGELNNNSIVMNIGMMSEYNTNIAPDVSLHRLQDTANPHLGDPDNANTSITDISLDPIDPAKPDKASQKLYFHGNEPINGVYLQNKQDPKEEDLKTVGLHNGSFVADTFQPLKEMKMFSICDEQEVGKMAKQLGENIILKGQLQCTLNRIQCQGKDPYGQELKYYCYLPVNEIAVTFHPNTTNFTCPFGYVDFSVPPVVGDKNPSNPPEKFDGEKWECWTWAAGVCINWQRVKRKECSWQSSQSFYDKTGIKSWGNFSIATGISAYSIWQPNPNGYECDYKGKTNRSEGNIQAVTCTTVSPTIDYYN